MKISIVVGSLLLACGLVSWQNQQLADQVARLETSNQLLEMDLQKKRAEIARVEALAESRSQELRGEIQQLWAQLGTRPTPRRADMASRSGRLHRQYRQLQADIAASRPQVLKARAERLARLRRTPQGAPCQGEMTSPFGCRTHPIYGTGRHHNGCDFTAEYGTKIFATADGKVRRSDWLGGYGQVIEIEHGHGVRTLYAHCSELLVKPGHQVQRGDLIARVGMTGLASGPHCHYEVHLQGEAVDPQPFLANHSTISAIRAPSRAREIGRACPKESHGFWGSEDVRTIERNRRNILDHLPRY